MIFVNSSESEITNLVIMTIPFFTVCSAGNRSSSSQKSKEKYCKR